MANVVGRRVIKDAEGRYIMEIQKDAFHVRRRLATEEEIAAAKAKVARAKAKDIPEVVSGPEKPKTESPSKPEASEKKKTTTKSVAKKAATKPPTE